MQFKKALFFDQNYELSFTSSKDQVEALYRKGPTVYCKILWTLSMASQFDPALDRDLLIQFRAPRMLTDQTQSATDLNLPRSAVHVAHQLLREILLIPKSSIKLT